jgi:hypothetical protein
MNRDPESRVLTRFANGNGAARMTLVENTAAVIKAIRGADNSLKNSLIKLSLFPCFPKPTIIVVVSFEVIKHVVIDSRSHSHGIGF